mmetsp:Transcript_10718/g.15671  ORF Transcript_10718/g.15671 Transcript_10718/m.15671 type:complete len:432 (+) Transcript_10718:125-1420(+)|eukprot:CAMPEP_0195523324 /NCGR_PEP_ID=MMETSP0794_2-20130614/22350_1 /TAXON_ID=515487 /ORGANISM="Stephanopyxis turris, Strain CCMP 815" /LENGTH=431 /DNA_ID=CAMNT_0040653297 /DNA_START=125 /DNA_END=1420 /DNA_ORIENTATION=+
MADNNLPAVVLDNGTGLTKMGYAGGIQPQYTIPTCIGLPHKAKQKQSEGIQDLDFYIGEEAQKRSRDYAINFPIDKGVVENWDNMEKLWQRCFFKYLKCEPENHHVLLTEPPLNAPENRELVAEIMFETFNVPGLYIAVSAVLALTAAWEASVTKVLQKKGSEGLAEYQRKYGFRKRTGAVIDSGDGITNVVPIYEGYVVGSSIRKIPVAGRDVTEFIKQMLRDRREPVPPEDLTEAATRIKENHCYICKDIVKEFQSYDKDLSSFKTLNGTHRRTKEPWQCSIGYERFLGPEVFFQPEMFSPDFNTPLAQVVDDCILSAPTDCRRQLYNNIVLSGGSTMFKAFGKRLERDIKKRVTARYNRNLELFNITKEEDKPKKLEVEVESSSTQKYAAWFGGSCLGAEPGFKAACHSRADYMEHGARIVRNTQGFA